MREQYNFVKMRVGIRRFEDCIPLVKAKFEELKKSLNKIESDIENGYDTIVFEIVSEIRLNLEDALVLLEGKKKHIEWKKRQYSLFPFENVINYIYMDDIARVFSEVEAKIKNIEEGVG